MQNNLATIEENKTIKSIDLVKIINQFRKLENKVELRHNDFMTKIRKEIKILEDLGLKEGLRNFSQSYYMNSQNKIQPCYLLNRDAMLQMLNSESALVRYKTIEYINKLEHNYKENVYRIDKSKYAFRNIEDIIKNSTYATLENEVDNIINFHKNLKAKERYSYYQALSKTEYLVKVKNHILNKIDKNILKNGCKDTLKVTVAYDISNSLRKQLLSTNKRSTSHIIKNTQDLLKEWVEYAQYIEEPSLDEYIQINKHPFSYNYALDEHKRKTKAYQNWINTFPYSEIPDINYWINKGVDFSKRLRIYIKFINKEKFDSDNLTKAFIDILFNEQRGVYKINDNIIKATNVETIENCNNFSEGKIFFYIENI